MKINRIIIITALILISSSIAFALSYTSPNYTMTGARVVISGGSAQSPSYALVIATAGNITGGRAESEHFTCCATDIERGTPPNPPTLDAPTTPTSSPEQLLTGTKDKDTAIYINGYQTVAWDDQTTWSYNLSLSEGENQLMITARNQYGLASTAVCEAILLDTSCPSTPLVGDDGQCTASLTQLHASWSSEDPQTGITEFHYAIGTTCPGTDIVDWTSCGAQTEVTHTGLSLSHGQTYYISVRAKNSVDIWSAPGTSDGICVNQNSPLISTMTPACNSSFHPQEVVNITAVASDSDQDSLLYQFSINGQVRRPWSEEPCYQWRLTALEQGLHTITVEVSDRLGGEDAQVADVYIFLLPAVPAR